MNNARLAYVAGKVIYDLDEHRSIRIKEGILPKLKSHQTGCNLFNHPYITGQSSVWETYRRLYKEISELI